MFGLFKKKEKEQKKVYAPVAGKVVSLQEVPDDAFANEMFGKGFAVIPENGDIYAPISGKIIAIQEPSLHAYGIVGEDGTEIMLHVGIDTVEMNGEGFETYVKTGDQIKAGDKLGKFDLDLVKEKGYETHVMVIFCNSETLELGEKNVSEVKDLGEPVLSYQLV